MSTSSNSDRAPVWHLLQLSDVLDLELAQALAETVSVIAWEPERRLLPVLTPAGNEAEREHPGSSLRIRKLPLLRGYARFPVSALARTGPAVVHRLSQQSDAAHSPLICTIPYFASVAERWPGPVVYWLTDLIARYASANTKQVQELDRRMCRAATLVCPNSNRLAQYLIERAGCDREKIVVVPNATRSANLLTLPPTHAAELPEEEPTLTRPVAGVIGNLAGNMDWVLLKEVIERTPWLTWMFVGPTSMHISDEAHAAAREELMQHPRARFVGKKPYGDLARYARAFDVAVLPYLLCEPTYSGSSTRFYEHLAACRPMIATRGFEELLHKPPLLRLVDRADEMIDALEDLRTRDFNDGLQAMRWKASRSGTWQTRAHTIQRGLAERSKPALTEERDSYLPVARVASR